MTTKSKRLYYQYLRDFRNLDPKYNIKGGYREARKDFVNFAADKIYNDQAVLPTDKKSYLFVKYLVERYVKQRLGAEDKEINRLKHIINAQDSYLEYRKKLDELRYEYYKRFNTPIGRIPKIYEEYKFNPSKYGAQVPYTFTKNELEKVKERYANLAGFETSESSFEESSSETTSIQLIPGPI